MAAVATDNAWGLTGRNLSPAHEIAVLIKAEWTSDRSKWERSGRRYFWTRLSRASTMGRTIKPGINPGGRALAPRPDKGWVPPPCEGLVIPALGLCSCGAGAPVPSADGTRGRSQSVPAQRLRPPQPHLLPGSPCPDHGTTHTKPTTHWHKGCWERPQPGHTAQADPHPTAQRHRGTATEDSSYRWPVARAALGEGCPGRG